MEDQALGPEVRFRFEPELYSCGSYSPLRSLLLYFIMGFVQTQMRMLLVHHRIQRNALPDTYFCMSSSIHLGYE
jgi:hypothetical protein